MTTASQIIEDNQAYASTWANRVESFLNALTSLGHTNISIDQPPNAQLLNFDGVSTALNGVLGQAPATPNISIPQEAPPNAPTITIPAIDDIAIPDFAIAAPAITVPAAPTLVLPDAPSVAPQVRDVVLPEAPTIEIPAAPTFEAISLPGPPEVELPSFDLSPPAIDINAPTASFQFAEQAYESDLRDGLSATLHTDLTSGDFGINTDDEIRTWGRAVAREQAQRRREVEEAARAHVSRRISFAAGALFAPIDAALQRESDAVSDINAQIAIKRSSDYIEARRFTITAATAFEQVLIQNHAGIMKRALNASRSLVEYGIQSHAKVAAARLLSDRRPGLRDAPSGHSPGHRGPSRPARIRQGARRAPEDRAGPLPSVAPGAQHRRRAVPRAHAGRLGTRRRGAAAPRCTQEPGRSLLRDGASPGRATQRPRVGCPR